MTRLKYEWQTHYDNKISFCYKVSFDSDFNSVCRMNTTEVKITKKQKLAMILMGITATLTQGARVQGGLLARPVER